MCVATCGLELWTLHCHFRPSLLFCVSSWKQGLRYTLSDYRGSCRPLSSLFTLNRMLLISIVPSPGRPECSLLYGEEHEDDSPCVGQLCAALKQVWLLGDASNKSKKKKLNVMQQTGDIIFCHSGLSQCASHTESKRLLAAFCSSHSHCSPSGSDLLL